MLPTRWMLELTLCNWMKLEQAASSTCRATRCPAAPELGLLHAALLAKSTQAGGQL